jgi:hypothetical protein
MSYGSLESPQKSKSAFCETILTHNFTHSERFVQSLSATWQPPLHYSD